MTGMDCRQTRELLCACIDEELEPGVASAVRQHLSECGSCAELYLAQRTVKGLLRRSRTQTALAPASLRERVWAAVVAQCRRPGEVTTVNTSQTTISTTTTHSSGALVRRTTVTGTVVRRTYRGPRPEGPGAGQA